MKSLHVCAIALLLMLVLAGCSAQMMAGVEGSEQYKNMAAGDAFLAENKKKEGVVALFSGMQYKVIQEGTGRKPTMRDKVSMHFTGKTIKGEVFEGTSGFPRTYPVNKLAIGMQMALTRMQEGAKWEVYLPPELAFGERGLGGVVGPNSTVIFEIELVKVK